MSHPSEHQLQNALTAVLEPSVREIDVVIKAVYDSQEGLAKQLDTIEITLAHFATNTPQNTSCKEYIDKILAIKAMVDSIQRRVNVLTQRTENVKQQIRDNQQVFHQQKSNNQPGVGIDSNDEHLLQ